MAWQDDLDISDGENGLSGASLESRQATAVLDKELAGLRDTMLFTSREVGTLSAGIGNGLRRAFADLALDGGKLSDALKDVARSMADSVFSIAMRPVQQALAGAIAEGGTTSPRASCPLLRGARSPMERLCPLRRAALFRSRPIFRCAVRPG